MSLTPEELEADLVDLRAEVDRLRAGLEQVEAGRDRLPRHSDAPASDDTEARLFATVFRTALELMRPSAGCVTVYDCAAAASAAERAVRADRGGGSE